MTALIWVLTASSVNKKDTVLSTKAPGAIFLDIDLSTYYHEKRAGRLVLDPMCIFFFSVLVRSANHWFHKGGAH